MNKIERTILMNQFRILARLDEDDKKSHERKAEILERGIEGMYGDVLLSNEVISSEICTETHHILSMYRTINNAIASLGEKERDSLDLSRIKFDGFDMNNDDHYHFADFMVEECDLYEELREQNLNSHSMASMMRYKRMLPIYRDFLAKGIYPYGLEELKAFVAVV